MVLFVLFPKQLAGPSKKKKVEEDTGPPVCINETKEKRFKDEKNMKVLLFVSMLDILKTIISNKQLILCFFYFKSSTPRVIIDKTADISFW